MARQDQLQAPDLPALTARQLHSTADAEGLDITAALVEHDGREPLSARRIRIQESELRGVTFAPGNVPGLVLSEVVMDDCDLSNVQAREGSIRRVEIRRSRLVGLALTDARIQDLRVVDASLTLGSFARSRLQRVIFEGVNLRETSFMDARLESVGFVDCALAGADFRGAKLLGATTISGSSLEGVVGVESLRGLTMSWGDIVSSAAVLAEALGIEIESTTPAD
jgi:uncharacterized protein YjbI with pentapeptide repeats